MAEWIDFLAGPTLGTTNTGIAIFEAPDETAARAITAADPGHRRGLRHRRAARAPGVAPARGARGPSAAPVGALAAGTIGPADGGFGWPRPRTKEVQRGWRRARRRLLLS